MENLRQRLTNFERKYLGNVLSTEVNKKGALELALAGIIATGIFGGCALSPKILPTNTYQNSKEGLVCTNEDGIKVQQHGILGKLYYLIPLNKENEILNGGEPSFAIIPQSESKRRVEGVGKEGGRIIVSAPKGGLYLPYTVFGSREKGVFTKYPEDSTYPFELTTTKLFKSRDKPLPNQGKITLEYLTEKDFSFSDETLVVEQEYPISKEKKFVAYVVNNMNDRGTSFPRDKEGVLPMYFTKVPFFVDYDETLEDKRVGIGGSTYVFRKGEKLENYIKERGLVKKEEKKNEEKPVNYRGASAK